MTKNLDRSHGIIYNRHVKLLSKGLTMGLTMKKKSKNTKKVWAIIGFVWVYLVIVVGAIFAFLPMTFGYTNYASLAKNIGQSVDITSGVYAEFQMIGSYSEEQLNQAKTQISEILADHDYINSNVYDINGKTLRVEISAPQDATSLSNAYNALSYINGGLFELKLNNSEDEASYVNGRDHVKSITISSYQGTHYVQINLNKAGTKQLEKLTTDAMASSSSAYYIFLGGKVYPDSSSGKVTVEEINTTGTITFGWTEYAYTEQFQMAFQFGCLPIELNANNEVVDVMQASIRGAELTKNATIIALICASVLSLLAFAIYTLVQYKLLGALSLTSVMLSIIFALLVSNAMPWVEVNTTYIFTWVIGILFTWLPMYIRMHTAQKEYQTGKTLQASIENASHKTLFTTIIIGISLFVCGMILAVVGLTSMRALGATLALFGALAILADLVLFRGLLHMTLLFTENPKLFHFTREER